MMSSMSLMMKHRRVKTRFFLVLDAQLFEAVAQRVLVHSSSLICRNERRAVSFSIVQKGIKSNGIYIIILIYLRRHPLMRNYTGDYCTRTSTSTKTVLIVLVQVLVPGTCTVQTCRACHSCHMTCHTRAKQ
jgi:hypothetical protein